MEATGQEGATSVDAHTPHNNIMGCCALYELKVMRLNHLSHHSRLGHAFPDLKDTRHIVRLPVHKKGMRVQPNGEAIVIQKRKGPLHTGLLK